MSLVGIAGSASNALIEYTKTTNTIFNFVDCEITNATNGIFHASAGTSTGPVVSISDCLISNSNSLGSRSLIDLESNMDMSLSISNTTFTNNTALQSSLIHIDVNMQGGVSLYFNVLNCTFEQNNANQLIYTTVSAPIEVTIQNNLIENNSFVTGIQYVSNSPNAKFNTSNNTWTNINSVNMLYSLAGNITSAYVDSTTIANVGGLLFGPPSLTDEITFLSLSNVTVTNTSQVMNLPVKTLVLSNVQVLNIDKTVLALNISNCQNMTVEDSSFVDSGGLLANYSATTNDFVLNRVEFTRVNYAIRLITNESANPNVTLTDVKWENCTSSLAPLTADMLTACRQLVTFQLKRVPLTSSDIQLFATHLLDQNVNLTKLRLKRIKLNSADLAVLAATLPPSLLHLDLRHNHLDESSVGLISNWAANSHFVKLRVEHQNWSSKVHGGLGKAMKTNTFLHKFTHRTTVPKMLSNEYKWCRFNRKRNMTLEDWCLGQLLKEEPVKKFVISFTGRPLKPRIKYKACEDWNPSKLKIK